MAEEATPAAGLEPTAPEPTSPADEPKVFDAEYVRKLRQEAAAHRKEAQEAKARNEEYENAQRSDLEKANNKAAKVERERDEARAALVRYEVATEKKVPAEMVALLTATTREGIESQADLILKNTKPPADPDFDGGPRDPAPPAKTPEQEHNELVLRDLFGART